MKYSLGDGIRKHRKNKNLTVEKLAELSGLEPNLITNVELGQSSMSFHKAIAVLNALNITFRDCRIDISNKDEKIFQIEKLLLDNELTERDFKFIKSIIINLNKNSGQYE